MNIFTIEEEKQIIDMYKNNVCIDDIINIFETQEKDIRLILKNNSVDRVYNSFSEELYDRIVKLYKDGNTQDYICEQLLIRDRCIVKTLRKRGEHVRTYSENNRRYGLNEYYFDKIDNPNKAYLLGMLYADGCNHVDHYAITLSLQEQDKDVVEFMKSEVEYEGPIRIHRLSQKDSRHKDQHILCINDQRMSLRLEELGVVQNKSLIIQFPKFITDDLMPHFIRGYFDGDGSLHYNEKHQKTYTSVVGTKDFCESLSQILQTLNCKHFIVHPKQCKDSNTFVLKTCGNKSSLTFLNWMYDNNEFHMERKYQKYLYAKEKYLAKMNA